MRLVRQRLPGGAAHHHDPLMRPIGLVGREEIDIRPKRGDIGQAVRRVGDAVDDGQRPGPPGGLADRGDIVDLADDVRAMRESNKPDLAVRHQGRQACRIEMPGLGVDLPLADLDPLALKPPPEARIRLVILVGDDNRLTRFQPLADGIGEHKGVSRGRGAEAELILLDIQHRRQAGAGLVHLLACDARDLVGRVGLDLARSVEPGQPVDHRLAGVAAAGVLEKGLTLQAGLGERGELGADEVDIECHGGSFGAEEARKARRRQGAEITDL